MPHPSQPLTPIGNHCPHFCHHRFILPPGPGCGQTGACIPHFQPVTQPVKCWVCRFAKAPKHRANLCSVRIFSLGSAPSRPENCTNTVSVDLSKYNRLYMIKCYISPQRYKVIEAKWNQYSLTCS